MAPQLGGAVHRSPPLTPPAGLSPKGWKRLEVDRLVGLAIVAALETPSPALIASTAAASSPISIASPRPGRHPEASEAWSSMREQDSAAGEVGGFRVADFLSHCHLCRKRLHGKDIYMYRGEKAFCSIECRCQQIISDEYQEICGGEAARPAAASATASATSSPYTGGGRIFFPGIVVS